MVLNCFYVLNTGRKKIQCTSNLQWFIAFLYHVRLMFICVYIKRCTHAKYEKFLNKACNSTTNRFKVFVHCNYQFIHKVIFRDFWQNVNTKLDLYKSIFVKWLFSECSWYWYLYTVSIKHIHNLDTTLESSFLFIFKSAR